MARQRKRDYRAPIAPATNLQKVALLSGESVKGLKFEDAFAPPGAVYPALFSPEAKQENPYRQWIIEILDCLKDVQPHPVNMAIECLRISLVEVERGIIPPLFKPAKSAKRKGNFAAHMAANRAVNAASYIHDKCGDDQAYEQYLKDAGTSRIEIDQWRKGRIDLQYRNHAIVAWSDFEGAKRELGYAILDYREHNSKKRRAI